MTRNSWILFGIVLAFILGWIIVDLMPTDHRFTLLLVLPVAILAPPVYLFVTGRRDILDPMYLTTAVFLLIFLARPLYDYANNSFEWVTIDVSDHLVIMLAAACLGVFCSGIGSISRLSTMISKLFPNPPAATYHSTIMACAFGLLTLAVGFKCLAAIMNGGLHTLLARREDLELTSANIAFLSEGFMVVLPALLLFYYLIPSYGWMAKLGMLLSSLVVFQDVIAGNRRRALAVVAALLFYYFLKNFRRPGVIGTLGILLLGFFVLVAPIQLSRSGERTIGQALEYAILNPGEAAENILLQSQTTSMLNAFGLAVFEIERSATLDFRYGGSILAETVLQPIPQEIWSSKPEPIRTLLIQSRWGQEGGRCVSLCPTVSPLSTFYSDFGLAGVALGSYVLGAFIRAPFEYYRLRPDNAFTQMAFASFASAPLNVWWDSVGIGVVAFGTQLLPILITVMIAGRRSRGLAGSSAIARWPTVSQSRV